MAASPATAAGRALLRAINSGVASLFAFDNGPDDPSPIPDAIAQVEAEARRLALAEAAEAVRGLPILDHSVGVNWRAAVLDALARLGDKP